jgi:hypothetical protein
MQFHSADGRAAVAVQTRRPGRGTLNLTLLSLLTLGTCVTLQHHDAREPSVFLRMTNSLQRVVSGEAIEITDTRSDFEKESSLTSRQLVDRWNPMITAAAKQMGLPESWIRAVIHQESGGRTMLGEGRPITSPVGAMGLMQLMPDTYGDMRRAYGLGNDAYDPQDNIMAGAAYLRTLYRKYGFPGMFAAYNDGPGNYEAHLYRGRALPVETLNYVAGVQRFLGQAAAKHNLAPGDVASLTRPNGTPITIARMTVRSIRAPLPGEYAPTVRAVISFGKKRQGVRETVDQARTALGVFSG